MNKQRSRAMMLHGLFAGISGDEKKCLVAELITQDSAAGWGRDRAQNSSGMVRN